MLKKEMTSTILGLWLLKTNFAILMINAKRNSLALRPPFLSVERLLIIK